MTTTHLTLTRRVQDASVAAPMTAFDAATTATEDATAAMTTDAAEAADVVEAIDVAEPTDLGRAARRLLRHPRRAGHDAGAVRRRW